MKNQLRLFLFNLFALWLVTQLIAGVRFSGGWQTLVLASFVLTLANWLIKPLVKLLLLPINLLTLGAFRWLINVVILYLVTLLVPNFKIAAFLFPGFSYQGFVIPSLHLTTFWVFVIVSFAISLVTTFLLWLVK